MPIWSPADVNDRFVTKSAAWDDDIEAKVSTWIANDKVRTYLTNFLNAAIEKKVDEVIEWAQGVHFDRLTIEVRLDHLAAEAWASSSPKAQATLPVGMIMHAMATLLGEAGHAIVPISDPVSKRSGLLIQVAVPFDVVGDETPGPSVDDDLEALDLETEPRPKELTDDAPRKDPSELPGVPAPEPNIYVNARKVTAKDFPNGLPPEWRMVTSQDVTGAFLIVPS